MYVYSLPNQAKKFKIKNPNILLPWINETSGYKLGDKLELLLMVKLVELYRLDKSWWVGTGIGDCLIWMSEISWWCWMRRRSTAGEWQLLFFLDASASLVHTPEHLTTVIHNITSMIHDITSLTNKITSMNHDITSMIHNITCIKLLCGQNFRPQSWSIKVY